MDQTGWMTVAVSYRGFAWEGSWSKEGAIGEAGEIRGVVEQRGIASTLARGDFRDRNGPQD